MANADTIEAREAMFQEMMDRLADIQSRYRGVRGELLQKVRDELARLQPGAANETQPEQHVPVAQIESTPEPVVAPVEVEAPEAITPAHIGAVATADEAPAAEVSNFRPKKPLSNPLTSAMMPSCRSCGRTMRESGDGSLICSNGHTRSMVG